MNDNNDIINEGLLSAIAGTFNQAERFKRRLTRFLKMIVKSKKFSNAFSEKLCTDDAAFNLRKFDKSNIGVVFQEFDKDLDTRHLNKLSNCEVYVKFDIDFEPSDLYSFLSGKREPNASSASSDDNFNTGFLGVKSGGETFADKFIAAGTGIDTAGYSELYNSVQDMTMTMTMFVKITNWSYKTPEKRRANFNAVANLDKSIFEYIEKMSGDVYVKFVVHKNSDEYTIKGENIGSISIIPDQPDEKTKKEYGMFANGFNFITNGIDSIDYNPSFKRSSEIGDNERFGGSSSKSSNGKQDKIRAAWNSIIKQDYKDQFILKIKHDDKSDEYSITIKMKMNDSDNDGLAVLSIDFKEN